MSKDPNTRTLCEILEDMRTCLKTHNFSYLSGLIEEAQYRVNRMENVIDSYHTMGWDEEKRIKLKAEIKDLEKEKDEFGV